MTNMYLRKLLSLCKICSRLDSQLPPTAREQKAPILKAAGRNHPSIFPPVHCQCGCQGFICQDLNREKRFLNLHKTSMLAKAGRDMSKTCPVLHGSAQEVDNGTLSLTSLEPIPTGLGQMLISSVCSRNDMALFHITATQKQLILNKRNQFALLWGFILEISLKQNSEIKLCRNNKEKAILHT